VRVILGFGPAFDCDSEVLLLPRRVPQRLSRRSLPARVLDELVGGLGGAMASEIVDGPYRGGRAWLAIRNARSLR